MGYMSLYAYEAWQISLSVPNNRTGEVRGAYTLANKKYPQCSRKKKPPLNSSPSNSFLRMYSRRPFPSLLSRGISRKGRRRKNCNRRKREEGWMEKTNFHSRHPRVLRRFFRGVVRSCHSSSSYSLMVSPILPKKIPPNLALDSQLTPRGRPSIKGKVSGPSRYYVCDVPPTPTSIQSREIFKQKQF